MSLTLKILLMVDVLFALLLLVYVIVKYVEVFNRKPKIFKPEIINGVGNLVVRFSELFYF